MATVVLNVMFGGFDEKNPKRPDVYSRASLETSRQVYEDAIKGGHNVIFCVPNTIAFNTETEEKFHELVARGILEAFPDNEVTIAHDADSRESLNGLSDIWAVAEFATKIPGSFTTVVAYAPAIVDYMDAGASAIKKHYCRDWKYRIVPAEETPPPYWVDDWKYRLQGCAVKAVGWNKWAFDLLYKAVYRASEGRAKEGFTVTLRPAKR